MFHSTLPTVDLMTFVQLSQNHTDADEYDLLMVIKITDNTR